MKWKAKWFKKWVWKQNRKREDETCGKENKNNGEEDETRMN